MDLNTEIEIVPGKDVKDKVSKKIGNVIDKTV